ncbi:hypothetical protein GCM10010381_43810 [Streptomyces xantholiticus]|nr:hypothetical protein GCM10010381_43810 [Streptomyces xantholiticus]
MSYGEQSSRAFLEKIPGRTAEFLDRWGLRIEGPSMYGQVSLVLPVARADGTPAAAAGLRGGGARGGGRARDRLLHWDLHFDNVLAAEREPWLVIDPKLLVGDPGFELCPRCGTASTRTRCCGGSIS